MLLGVVICTHAKQIWDLPRQTMRCELAAPDSPPGRIPYLAFSQSDSLLFEGWDYVVRTWDISAQSILHVLQLGDSLVGLEASLHDPCLGIVCERRTIVQGNSRVEITEAIGALAFIPTTSHTLLTGREKGEGLRVWDFSSALQPAQATSNPDEAARMPSTDLAGPQVIFPAL